MAICGGFPHRDLFFFEITGGTRRGKWQAKRTVICHALTWNTFSRSVTIFPFRHTNSWAIWDEDLSKMENPPPWLFKHSRAGAHQGEGGGSGLPDVQTTRGCTVCREFKESNELSKSTFYYHYEQAVLNSIHEKNSPPSWDVPLPSSFPHGTPVQ